MLKIILPLVLMGPVALDAQEIRERALFNFQDARAANGWQTVNDGVMGGRSAGRFIINGAKKMEFFGNLSLANNGGFASVRSRRMPLGLFYGDSIVVRLRGDGRTYNLNLYTPNRQTAFSYRASFQTLSNQWIEVAFPLDRFVATSFGRVVPNRPLDPKQVNGIGILLGDKRPGPFKLEVDWINVRQSSPTPTISNTN
jgi:monofunctional biosynthetic peptidoglycan transglycosylase